MIEFLTNYKDMISISSNIVTMLAFILAIWAFFSWKKEQKFSKQLEYIMELEDSFEILMSNIITEYNWMSEQEKGLLYADNFDKEQKKQLHDSIKKEYEKYARIQTIEQSFSQYNLSIVRVKRFFENIDIEYQVLNYDYLNKLYMKNGELKPKWKDKDNIAEEAKKHLEEIKNIHQKGLKCIQKKYK